MLQKPCNSQGISCEGLQLSQILLKKAVFLSIALKKCLFGKLYFALIIIQLNLRSVALQHAACLPFMQLDKQWRSLGCLPATSRGQVLTLVASGLPSHISRDLAIWFFTSRVASPTLFQFQSFLTLWGKP